MSASPATPAGALRATVLSALSRVRSHRFWRLVYGLLARESTVRATAWLLRRRGGEDALNRFAELVVRSGWPTHPRGWKNLDLSRFEWRVRRRLSGARPCAARQPRARPGRLRVGIVGEFSWLINFSTDQLRPLAERADATILDLEYKGRTGAHLAALPGRYVAVPAEPSESAEVVSARIAAAANAADLDLLLLLLGQRLAYPTLDQVDVPCVGNLPTGTDLLYHERVGFQVFFQPQADYFLRNGTLFCGTTAAPFGIEGIEPGFLVNDLRGVEPGGHTSWEEREPLLVAHGSLYKLATPAYLDCIFRLLEEDASRSFVFMGKDDGTSLEAILSRARRRGLASRVVYDGAFDLFRSEDGSTLADEGWLRLVDHLGRARLAPDYWPISGGATRLEAYALGAPTAHLGICYEPSCWGRPQPTVLELADLGVPLATARSPEEYLDLCRRCLGDGEFARAVVDAQLEVVRRVTDADAYWDLVLGCYERWLRRRSRTLAR